MTGQLNDPKQEVVNLHSRASTVYLPDAVFKQHDHPHPGVAVFDEVHQSLVIGLLHVGAVDGEYDIALPHSRPVGGTVVVHVIDVGDHLDLLLFLVVDAVALEGETVRAVLLLHYDGPAASVFFRFRHRHPVRLHSFQDL